jgi:hypothetical protein
VLSLKEMGNVRRHAQLLRRGLSQHGRGLLDRVRLRLGEPWNGLGLHAPSLRGGVRLCAGVLLLAVALLAGGARPASAQGPNQVAIVVQYGSGEVSTYCVSFDSPTISGLEALQQAGIKVVYEGGALGARVCKIGPVGCDLPGNCFCQCKGTECLYWSYWHLADGAWQYAIVGAASYQVAPGSVEGWSWGIGTPNQAPQPPVMSFAAICAPSTATPVPTQAAAETETPTPPAGEQPSSPTPATTTPATPTPVPSATPTSTEAPTETATAPAAGGAQASPTPGQPTSTQQAPTHTPGATGTPAASAAAGPTATLATPTPVAPAGPAPAYTNYIFFGAIVLVLIALGAYVLLRR